MAKAQRRRWRKWRKSGKPYPSQRRAVPTSNGHLPTNGHSPGPSSLPAVSGQLIPLSGLPKFCAHCGHDLRLENLLRVTLAEMQAARASGPDVLATLGAELQKLGEKPGGVMVRTDNPTT